MLYLPAILEVNIRICLDEMVYDSQVANRCGEVQAGALIVIGGIDLTAAAEQHLEQVEAATSRQLTQLARCRAFVVAQLAAPIP